MWWELEGIAWVKALHAHHGMGHVPFSYRPVIVSIWNCLSDCTRAFFLPVDFGLKLLGARCLSHWWPPWSETAGSVQTIISCKLQRSWSPYPRWDPYSVLTGLVVTLPHSVVIISNLFQLYVPSRCPAYQDYMRPTPFCTNLLWADLTSASSVCE